MSEFSADWLALREPFDAASRSLRLARAVADTLPRYRTVDILDLGAGTGANVRYLAGKLPLPQRWLLVDRDERLLSLAPKAWPSRCLDLQLAVLDPALFAGRALVTASALLDLVSHQWLEALVARCVEAGAAVLFTLTYDGRIDYAPAEPEDDWIRDLVNHHQQTDKGLGRAAGPNAAMKARELLTGAGYHIEREASDWVLTTPESQTLQRQLIDGWAAAATAIASEEAAVIADWRERRLAHVETGASQLIVGHKDLAGWLRAKQTVGALASHPK
jgi:hypothetical protein